MSFLIGLLTFILILVSLFLILVVLAQKTKDGGMGAALGGGATESAFGADTGNVLSKATINAAIAFFVLSFVLYLSQIYTAKHAHSSGPALPSVPVSTASLPLVPAATAPAPTTAPVAAATGNAAAAAPTAPATTASTPPAGAPKAP